MGKPSSIASTLKDEYKRLTTVFLYFRNGSVLTGLCVLCSPSNIFQLFPMLPLLLVSLFNCGVSARLLEAKMLNSKTLFYLIRTVFLVTISLITCMRYKQAKNKKKVSAMLIF